MLFELITSCPRESNGPHEPVDKTEDNTKAMSQMDGVGPVVTEKDSQCTTKKGIGTAPKPKLHWLTIPMGQEWGHHESYTKPKADANSRSPSFEWSV
jgi:hypothetical protein